MNYLINCYSKPKPVMAYALLSFWVKMYIECGGTHCTEEERKEIKKKTATICIVCDKEESEDNNNVTLVKCGICKYYAYCGKDCQTYTITQVLQAIIYRRNLGRNYGRSRSQGNPYTSTITNETWIKWTQRRI